MEGFLLDQDADITFHWLPVLTVHLRVHIFLSTNAIGIERNLLQLGALFLYETLPRGLKV